MGLSELEHLSLEVDEKLLRFMDQLELLEEKRVSLNALIEQGWFSISKARYSMGNKQVSSLQYASEIEPLLCVYTQKLDNGEIKYSTNTVNGKSNDDLKPVQDIGPQETGVRRRNKKLNVDEKEESEETISEQTYEYPRVRKCGHNPQQDPLKWFGILVPQSLKQAQTSFKQVIELSAEIASLQTTILNSREELWKDMEKKLKIQVKDSSHNVDQVEN
uniref:Vacuolar ATPase assembly protein VMA22 n=1 Tax=Neogobius melanostomus TaxID=47308 RepID=A0A8C6TEA3_9GOBI